MNATASTEAKLSRARRRAGRLDLRELAYERGYRSLDKLATDSGVSQPILSQMGRGMIPKPITLSAIAKTLGVSNADLLEALSASHETAKRAVPV